MLDLFKRKPKPNIQPPDPDPPRAPVPPQTRHSFTRCVCNRAFKPEKDMETYCSVQCAREDSLKALSGGDTLYKKKVMLAESGATADRVPSYYQIPDRLRPKPRPKPLPPTPTPPTPPTFPAHPTQIVIPDLDLFYTPLNVRPLPPIPADLISHTPIPVHRQVAPTWEPVPVPERRPRRPSAKRNQSPGPSGSRNRHGQGHDTYKLTIDTQHVPPLPIPIPTYNPANPPTERTRPKGARREHTPSKKKIAVRRSASMSFLREAGSLWADVPPDWRTLEPMPLPPGMPSTQPLQFRPRDQVGNSSFRDRQVPDYQEYGYNWPERNLRHSQSLNSIYTRSRYVADVPEDVYPYYSPIEQQDPVWWVVKELREVKDEDHKERFLTRQTPRW
ncbi:hypothetical protein NLI96_g5088 [Meripilus lineatus]|uniref:Uncharacterized protein n=1 Tax=Meripilus lineatus TaxID=2056292 RepID=A0AAD5YH96_9APHY|nr:hypothetical protein NLI96_g5088 [Physisporinus lineatus]